MVFRKADLKALPQITQMKFISSKQRIKRKLIVFFVTSIGLLSINFNCPMRPKPLRAAPLNQLSRKSFVAQAVARTGPAVVTLETERQVITQESIGLPPGLLMDPYFRRFFGIEGMRRPKSRIERSQGSGVIFAPEGLVLTNAHVVENTSKVVVGMSDGQRIGGRVVGRDSLTDLAVIRLRGSGPWPTAPLGNSDSLVVGDWAIAVGNPFGLENTVTLGIISNLNRNVAQLGISGKRLDLIQTDAAINPGNSGGPLLNADGEVIGINTLVRSGPGAGLGFAIPINRARKIAQQLIERGRASHPMIGVSLSQIPLNKTHSQRLRRKGALVQYVLPRSPGDLGGLEVGDIIISVGGKAMKGPGSVVKEINSNGVNKPLGFEVIRGTRMLQLKITPIEMNNIEAR